MNGQERYVVHGNGGGDFQVVDTVENREVCVTGPYDNYDHEDALERAKAIAAALNSKERTTQGDPADIFGSEMVEEHIQRCPDSDYGHGLAYFTTKDGRRIFVWEHGNQWWSFLMAVPADIPLEEAVKIAELHCLTDRQWSVGHCAEEVRELMAGALRR